MLAICLFQIPYGFCPLLGRCQMLLYGYDSLFFVPGLHSLKDGLMLLLYAVEKLFTIEYALSGLIQITLIGSQHLSQEAASG